MYVSLQFFACTSPSDWSRLVDRVAANCAPIGCLPLLEELRWRSLLELITFFAKCTEGSLEKKWICNAKRMRMHEILMVYWDVGSQFSKLEKVHTQRQTWIIIPRFSNVIPAIWFASSFICPQGCWYAANEYVRTSPSKLQIALAVLLQWRGSLARSLFPSERKESGSYTRRTCLETRKPVMNEFLRKRSTPSICQPGSMAFYPLLRSPRRSPGPCQGHAPWVGWRWNLLVGLWTSSNITKWGQSKGTSFFRHGFCARDHWSAKIPQLLLCCSFLFRTQAKLDCTSVDCPEFRYSDTIGWIVSYLPKRRGRQ